MQEATIVERLRNRSSVHTVVNATEESASLIERQQQVIDLLMKAVEPFSGVVTYEHLRRDREAKVAAEKLLNSTPSTEDERLMRSPDRQLNPRECIRCAELRWRAIPLRCPQCEFVYSMWQTALSNGERTQEHSDKDSG